MGQISEKELASMEKAARGDSREASKRLDDQESLPIPGFALPPDTLTLIDEVRRLGAEVRFLSALIHDLAQTSEADCWRSGAEWMREAASRAFKDWVHFRHSGAFEETLKAIPTPSEIGQQALDDARRLGQREGAEAMRERAAEEIGGAIWIDEDHMMDTERITADLRERIRTLPLPE